MHPVALRVLAAVLASPFTRCRLGLIFAIIVGSAGRTRTRPVVSSLPSIEVCDIGR
jgi:hypothetical protein